MKAVISTTYDDKYFFYLPITAWAWNKLGVNVICFSPATRDIKDFEGNDFEKKMLVVQTYLIQCNSVTEVFFNSPIEKEATYSQCSRLYAAATPLFADDEVLITGDVDMAVFNAKYFSDLNNSDINIVGADLVPDGQYPICYISMPVHKWKRVMEIPFGADHQDKLDQLLGELDCEHFRGNYWSKDQETIYNQIWLSLDEFCVHFRAKPGTQFATRRADRDGWPEVIAPDIIDAHLPRPGYTPENFSKILNLFQTMYPQDDFTWMIDYRNEYVKLLNP